MDIAESVLIAKERHLLVLGQIGNLKIAINLLQKEVIENGHNEYLPAIDNLYSELRGLRNIYPQLSGAIAPGGQLTGLEEISVTAQENYQVSNINNIKGGLRRMRALANAAYASYLIDGAIDCRLKAMFDEEFDAVEIETGITTSDDASLHPR